MFRRAVTPILAALAATLLAGPPARGNNLPVLQIASMDANDDSVRINIAPFPGAKDYRVYGLMHSNMAKYSGGNTTLELNGLMGECCGFVVEALDRLGPYELMNGQAVNPNVVHHINGHGPAANVPVVLARSATLRVNLKKMQMRGEQVFLDKFDGPFNPVRVTPDPQLKRQHLGDYFELESERWRFFAYHTGLGFNRNEFRLWQENGHLMDVLTDYARVAYGSLMMRPKTVSNIAGGKALHATMEVDAHFSPRRWCDIFIVPKGHKIRNPDWRHPDVAPPTKEGTSLIVSFLNDAGRVIQFDPEERTDLASYQRWGGLGSFNGRDCDIDLRHRFDVVLTQERILVFEEGKLVIDSRLAKPLPYTEYEVYFTHHLYHSALDKPWLKQYSPGDIHWINNTPITDERHWDNMGVQVITSLSQAIEDSTPPTVRITSPKPSATIKGRIQVSLAARDNTGIERIEFFVDGARVHSGGPQAPVYLQTRNFSNGLHTLVARAYDIVGNYADSPPVAVTIRN